MSEEQKQEVEETKDSVLNMSDDDMLEFDPTNNSAQENTTEDEKEEEEQSKSEVEEPEEDDQEEEELPERENIYANKSTTSEDEEEDEEEVDTTPDTSEGTINYKEEYERLLSPFRASKRDIKVNSIDDARRLMQMGADYQFKMQALKPQLRIMRTLEKNGLLNQDKINFLIDLDKKNPEAVKKYLKDKQIDPIELDLSEESSYQPKSYAPSEQESALDDVLEEIKETPAFQRTIDELGNKWDSESKKMLMEHPGLIKVINDQINTGVYDQVRNLVENERLLGRLEGLNDLMAYKTVGEALQAQGAFDHLSKQPEPQRKASQDPKLKARKRAASPTKRSSPATTQSNDFNPLALSDEEFEKMAKPAFAA